MKLSEAVYELRYGSTPKLELLAPGLFVICKYFGPRDIEKEWHRAMILENPAYADRPGPISKHHSLEKLDPRELSQVILTVSWLVLATFLLRSHLESQLTIPHCSYFAPLGKTGGLWDNS